NVRSLFKKQQYHLIPSPICITCARDKEGKGKKNCNSETHADRPATCPKRAVSATEWIRVPREHRGCSGTARRIHCQSTSTHSGCLESHSSLFRPVLTHGK